MRYNPQNAYSICYYCKEEISCDVALAQTDESGIRLYVTTLKDKDNIQIAEINANVFIPKENMMRFTYEIVSALKEYGEKYDDKYFVYTGNTNFGIQNLEYVKEYDCMLAAVYRGRKPQFSNKCLYAIDLSKESKYENSYFEKL